MEEWGVGKIMISEGVMYLQKLEKMIRTNKIKLLWKVIDELMVMIDELNSRLNGKGLGFRVRMEVYYENSTNQ